MNSYAYRMGLIVAATAGALQLWVNLAVGITGDRENPANLGFYLIVMMAVACAFTAQLRPDGMARAMLATAAGQVLLGVVVATAPVNASEAAGILALSGGFALLWTIAASFFRRSARPDVGRARA